MLYILWCLYHILRIKQLLNHSHLKPIEYSKFFSLEFVLKFYHKLVRIIQSYSLRFKISIVLVKKNCFRMNVTCTFQCRITPSVPNYKQKKIHFLCPKL